MRLTIDAAGATVLDRELLRMAGRVDDLSEVMETVIDSVLASAEKQFDTEGAHGSGGWAPLAQSTIERKAQAGLDPRILHATLDLRRSLTERGGDNVAIAERDGATVDTTVEYAKYLRDKRPLIQPTELERRGWVKAVQHYVVSGDRMRGTGLLAGVI